jgi:hypothetical protein
MFAPFCCPSILHWTFFAGADGILGTVSLVFFALIILFVVVAFTVIFFKFKGIRYRCFIDRIEYQRGRYPRFELPQKLFFSELNSIFWQVGESEMPYNTTYIEFHFATRVFQTHKNFDLSCQFSEICKAIEQNVIVPKIIKSIENGEAVTFLHLGDHTLRKIVIDKEGITNWDQQRLLWEEIRAIRFSAGEATGYCNFLVQNCISIENALGKVIKFDMPRHNPYAFWAVLVEQCKLPALHVYACPKDLINTSPSFIIGN